MPDYNYGIALPNGTLTGAQKNLQTREIDLIGIGKYA